MIGKFLNGVRDFIQLSILLLVLFAFFKIFNLFSLEDFQNWVKWRTAISHIERKETSLIDSVEGLVWRSLGLKIGQDDDRAITLLCELAKGGKEEAELLLLIYDMGMSDCADPADAAPADATPAAIED